MAQDIETEPAQQTDVESSRDSENDSNVAIKNDTFAIRKEALGIDLPPHYWRSPGFIGTVVALCISNTSGYAGWVQPSNSLATINADIGPSDNISWVSLASTIGLSVGFLLVGRMSDIFGRRWFFIGGNFLALLCGILGAVAQDINTLIGGNVLGGLACAVQISFTVVISELVPNKHRPLWVAAIFFSSVEFSVFGPEIAQLLVVNTAARWRWNYYLDIIVAGSACILFFVFYHPPTFGLLHSNRSRMEQLKRQDGVGLVLFTSGLILFIMGLSWGGDKYPWNSAHVIVTIAVGFLALVAFVCWDAFCHRGDPLLPLHLFQTRGYMAMVITAMVGACVYYSMSIIWPQQIAYLFGGSLVHRGWLACVVGGGALAGQLLGAALCQYIKQSRWILIYGTVQLLAFSTAMISIAPGEVSKGVSLMFMACFSVGVIEICSLTLAPLALPSEDIGAALGTLGSIRSAGASVATAIYITILDNKLAKYLPEYVSPAAVNAGLPQSSLPTLFSSLAAENLTGVPGITPAIIAAVEDARAQAAATSFRYVWYAVCAFAACAVMAACMTINYGQYLNDTVERKLHGKSVTAAVVARGTADGHEKG